MKQEQVNRALVFTRTKHGADKVVKTLEKAGIPASAIHGNKSQNHRERTLALFRTGEIRTLVATDIAARGIDVDGITHVINFDLPNVPETYVHRIGRTARAGAEGTAISLVAGGEELSYLRDIERLIKVALPREDRRTDAGRRDAGPPPQQQRQGRPGRPGQRPQGARHGEGRHADGRRADERHTDGRHHSAAKQGDGRGAGAAGPAAARRQLLAAAPEARRILRQTAVRNSVPRIAPGRLMGYKALPFCAARVGRTANRTANPIRTSRPRPGEIHG